MPIFVSSPFEDLVAKATNEQNVNDDWSIIMDICDKIVNYDDGSKYCLQAIGKRLFHKVPRVVMQALNLLDACVKNCGKKFHMEVSSRYFVDQIPKLLSKMHETTATKLKQLIKKWTEAEFKEDPELGLIPSLYYRLKSDGVIFPTELDEPVKKSLPPVSLDPNVVNSQQEEEDIIKAIALSLEDSPSPELCDIGNDSSSATCSSSSAVVDSIKVRALYDFEAVEDNELTIKSGEIVFVTDRSNSSWWKGNNHRGDGYFPANFITEDLEAPIIQHNVVQEDEEETLPKRIDEEDDIVFISEEKIDQCLDYINGIDPTTEFQDPDDLLILERYCYGMTPLIEEQLQEIDKRCTLLNSINEELVDAVQLFYELNSLGPSVNAHPEQAAQISSLKFESMQRYIPQYMTSPSVSTNPVLTVPHGLFPTVVNPVTHGSVVTTMASSSPQNVVTYQPVFPAVAPLQVISGDSNLQYHVVYANMQNQPVMAEMAASSIVPSVAASTAGTNLHVTSAQQSNAVPMSYQSVALPTHYPNQNSATLPNYPSLAMQAARFIHSYQPLDNSFIPESQPQASALDGAPSSMEPLQAISSSHSQQNVSVDKVVLTMPEETTITTSTIATSQTPLAVSISNSVISTVYAPNCM